MSAFRFMAVALLLSAVCACTDEAPPSPPMGGTDGFGGFDGTGGSGGSGGSGGNGGTAGSGGTGGTAGAGGVGGANAGACDNPDDIAALADLMRNAREVSATCAVTQCQLPFSDEQEDEFTICVGACVEEDIPGLSSQCALCYADLEWCIGDVLIWTRCATAPCEPQCLDDTLQCRNELDLCTGRMSTDCDV